MYKGSFFEDILSNNSYLYDFGLKVKNYRNNKRIGDFYKNISKIDSINNYDLFREEICRVKRMETRIQPVVYGTDALFYGHIQALYNYAGISSFCNYKALAGLEHGIDYSICPIDRYKGKMFTSFWYQSDYKKMEVHKDYQFKPVFVIGPYIHYASHYYGYNKRNRIKNKYGKTLLVFPFHDYELSSTKTNDEVFVDFVMERLACDFDTVVVCVYWNDVDKKMYELFRGAGAKLVSAGYRGDPNFIGRLKSIIDIADVVCGNAFGTFIGYALNMNKPFVYFPSKILFNDISGQFDIKLSEIKTNEVNKLLLELFGFSNHVMDNKESAHSFYEYYWGGEKYIRTPQEIKCMIEICEYLQKKTKGFCFLNDHFVKELLSSGDDLTRRLLRESLADE